MFVRGCMVDRVDCMVLISSRTSFSFNMEPRSARFPGAQPPEGHDDLRHCWSIE
jgi:hypothetical protein